MGGDPTKTEKITPRGSALKSIVSSHFTQNKAKKMTCATTAQSKPHLHGSHKHDDCTVKPLHIQ